MIRKDAPYGEIQYFSNEKIPSDPKNDRVDGILHSCMKKMFSSPLHQFYKIVREYLHTSSPFPLPMQPIRLLWKLLTRATRVFVYNKVLFETVSRSFRDSDELQEGEDEDSVDTIPYHEIDEPFPSMDPMFSDPKDPYFQEMNHLLPLKTPEVWHRVTQSTVQIPPDVEWEQSLKLKESKVRKRTVISEMDEKSDSKKVDPKHEMDTTDTTNENRESVQQDDDFNPETMLRLDQSKCFKGSIPGKLKKNGYLKSYELIPFRLKIDGLVKDLTLWNVINFPTLCKSCEKH